MKAINILEQAVLLAGGTTPDETLKKAAVSIINTVLTDLGEKNIGSLADDMSFSSLGMLTVLTSGVAMLLAILWGDDEGAARLSDLYNSSRRQALGKISKVRTTLFGGEQNEA